MTNPLERASNAQRPSSSQQSVLRYAVLWHTGNAEPHFDLMIERYPGSDLATWRCPIWPIDQLTELTRLRDHRRIYLSFEGVLSDDRGTVQRVADGVCQLQILDDQAWIVTPTTGNAIQLTPLGREQWQAQPLR